MYRFIALVFVIYIFHVNSYVLNDVQKDSTPKVYYYGAERASSNNVARRHYYEYKNQESDENKNMARSSKKMADKSVEKVIYAFKNGVKKVLKKHNVKADFLDRYAKRVVEYLKGNTEPLFRAASEKYNINPEVVHFRSGKPSLKIEINPTSISQVISDFLQSEAFTRNFDNLIHQAAVVYCAFKDE